MLKLVGTPALIAAAVLVLGGTGATAQGAPSTQNCVVRAAEAISASRESAMDLAYESVLQSVDRRMAQTWASRGRRIGDAPGYQVRKINTRCTPRGTSQSCTVEASLCRG